MLHQPFVQLWKARGCQLILICAVGLLHRGGNLSLGLVSGYIDGHHAIFAGKAQASTVPGESLGLAGSSLANSLSTWEP